MITEGKELFAKALEAAETESQKYQLERAKVQVDFLESYYLAVKYGVAIGVKELVDWNYANVEDTWNGAVNKILTNFFKANPDMFTKQETIQYRVEITNYVAKAVYNSYLQHNKDLFAAIKKFDFSLDEGDLAEIDDYYDDIALAYLPQYWDLAQDMYVEQ